MRLKRLVLLAVDASLIGGIPNRIRGVLGASAGRTVEYFGLSARHTCPVDAPNLHSFDGEPENTRKLLRSWSPSDTVFVIANNVLSVLPAEVQQRIKSFPLIFMYSGQLAFMIQDSMILANREYTDNLHVSKIISLSDADINFQRQLGIHGQVKGFLPVKSREVNSYDPKKRLQLGYVGRIDFHAKDCMKLIEALKLIKNNDLPPLKIFTTTHGNSPDYAVLLEEISRNELTDYVDIVLECTDKDVIYSDIGLLLLPSKKEAFGNVILEAYSYGIPVVGAAYAPGPGELIEDGRTGFLLSDFNEESLAEIINSFDARTARMMSKNAFARHKQFSMDAHFSFLEKEAEHTLQTFDGENRKRVFPHLRLAEVAQKYRSENSNQRNLVRGLFSRIVTLEDLDGKGSLGKSVASERPAENAFGWMHNQKVAVADEKGWVKITKAQPHSTPGVIKRFRLEPGKAYAIVVEAYGPEGGTIFVSDAMKQRLGDVRLLPLERGLARCDFVTDQSGDIYAGVVFRKDSPEGSHIWLKSLAIHEA